MQIFDADMKIWFEIFTTRKIWLLCYLTSWRLGFWRTGTCLTRQGTQHMIIRTGKSGIQGKKFQEVILSIGDSAIISPTLKSNLSPFHTIGLQYFSESSMSMCAYHHYHVWIAEHNQNSWNHEERSIAFELSSSFQYTENNCQHLNAQARKPPINKSEILYSLVLTNIASFFPSFHNSCIGVFFAIYCKQCESCAAQVASTKEMELKSLPSMPLGRSKGLRFSDITESIRTISWFTRPVNHGQ